jgi:biopolymer transport protein ExbD
MSPSIRRRKSAARISITPLVDVVFILMIFFMLASRFTQERQIDLTVSGPTGASAGETRFLLAGPDYVSLDGEKLTSEFLIARLRLDPAVKLAIKPVDGATIQRIIDVVDIARTAGVTAVTLAR